MTWKRTIVSAMKPVRHVGRAEVLLVAWFEEIDGPVPFVASPFDCEEHGRELWIRAMAGEYGPVELTQPPRMVDHDDR